MKSAYPGSLKGLLLVAMPVLTDPNFNKSVTCICEHDGGGALGIIVNRPDPTLRGRDIFNELSMAFTPATGAIPIHIGGPVHANEVFILHGPPFDWEGCHLITATMALSNTPDILQSIAAGKGPADYLVSLGCAGWGGGQLEAELKENTWLTSRIYEDAVFKWEPDNRWKKVLQKNGINPTGLSSTAGHA